MPPTIRDVAKYAGVSVATVSRVMNNTAQVRDETRDRVLNAIQDLGFSPNSAARQLSGGKTFTIGVISPFFTRPAFTERLAGIQAVLDQSDYDLVLYSINSIQQLDRRMHMLIAQNRVDALITLSVHIREKVILESRPDLPVIGIDDERLECYPSIVIDNILGGQMAAEYLIQKGHQKIGFIGDEPDRQFGFVSTQRRLEGFSKAMQKAGLTLNPAWQGFSTHGRDQARELAYRILGSDDRPTAIFAASDTQAFGVIAAARELGLHVPQDIAIMGFDDIEAAEYMNLTTIRAGMFYSGELSAHYMLNWLNMGQFGSENWQTSLPLEIVLRGSA